jgi:hypothetical protein
MAAGILIGIHVLGWFRKTGAMNAGPIPDDY